MTTVGAGASLCVLFIAHTVYVVSNDELGAKMPDRSACGNAECLEL